MQHITKVENTIIFIESSFEFLFLLVIIWKRLLINGADLFYSMWILIDIKNSNPWCSHTPRRELVWSSVIKCVTYLMALLFTLCLAVCHSGLTNSWTDNWIGFKDEKIMRKNLSFFFKIDYQIHSSHIIYLVFYYSKVTYTVIPYIVEAM